MNIENGASSVRIPSEKPESRKVYPFSMRKLKEQAKKICNKNGGDFYYGCWLLPYKEKFYKDLKCPTFLKYL